jgi:peptide/nickel transport system permease protein
MSKYVIRRLAMAVPVLLLSSLIVFGLMRVMPGDALTALMAESGNVGDKELAKLRQDLGLDRPYYQQYLLWAWQMVTLNPGYSIFTNEPIPEALKKAIPVSVELATLAMILGLVIAVPVGVLSATRQDRPADYAGRLVAISGLSLPDFWLGTLVITFAAIWFHWIPPIGYTSFWESPSRNLQQFLLPAAVLGFRLSAATMRMTRSTVLEVLREDYVRTARAKGLAGKVVIYKHALKNALIPVVTIVGGQLGTLLAGTVIVETIFALPGMGRLTVEAILFRDYPVVQTNVMLGAATLVTLNLLVDLTYGWLDPRIHYGSS